MFGLNFNLYHNFALMLSSKERCFKSEARFVASTDAVVEKILAFFDHLSTPGQVDISEGIPLMLQGKLCICLVNLVCEHSIFKNCELFSFFSHGYGYALGGYYGGYAGYYGGYGGYGYGGYYGLGHGYYGGVGCRNGYGAAVPCALGK
jgi:hypothetical protein